MSNWWYATSVDVTNGSKQVKINDGEDIRYLERGSAWLKVVGHEAVETDGAFENAQGEKIIRLVQDWAGQTDLARTAVAFRTVPDFQGVADKLALNIQRSQEVVDNVISKIGTLLTSTDEAVIIETSEGDVEVVPFARLVELMEAQFADFLQSNQVTIDAATSLIEKTNIQRAFDERCTLILDFANNHYEAYTGIAAGNKERSTFADLVSFSRGGEKTGFDALRKPVVAGENVPVFDWSDSEALGLSVHGQHTNLILDSESGVSGYPTRAGVVDSGAFSFVDNGIYVQQPEVPFGIYAYRRVTFPAGLTEINMLFLVEMDDGSEPTLGRSGSDPTADIIPFILGSTLSVGYEYQKMKIGRAWLISVSQQADLPSVTNTSNGLIQYAGNSGKPFKAAVLQLTETRIAVPYIKTTGLEKTTQADQCSIQQVDLSNWSNPFEGTYVIEWEQNEIPKYDVGILSLNDGGVSSSNVLISIQSRADRSAYALVARVSPSGGEFITTAFAPKGPGRHRAILSYLGNKVSLSVDGYPVATSLSTRMNWDQVWIGSILQGLNTELNGSVRTLKYSPYAVTDAKLQELSTQ